MELNEIKYAGQPPIDAYGPGFFRVHGVVQDGLLAILPSGMIAWDGLSDWQAVIAARPEYDVIFVGMGADIAPMPAAAKKLLDKANIPYEIMATPVSCRTYNVLLSEGRRVAIVALPV
ncbi:MAG: Mth938-like domain-containing protein [Proteobacteria bacterium]|nr:Mth938-like domain-containing protein [Pseudomonadota bacterium]